MRKTVLRRLEALEKEYRSSEQRELHGLRTAQIYIWKIVLAYYLGGLKLDEERPSDAEASALKYRSEYEFFDALLRKDIVDIHERYNDAYHRLFAKVGLDFNNTPRNELFEAFVAMVNQLPDKWRDWLRSNFEQYCQHVEIAAGSNLPRRLSADNFFFWR
jgi:hypothetical protein